MTDYGADDNQQEMIDRIVYMVQACQNGERPLTDTLAGAIINHCLVLLTINGRLKPFVSAVQQQAQNEAIQEWGSSSNSLSDSRWYRIANELQELVDSEALDPSE